MRRGMRDIEVMDAQDQGALVGDVIGPPFEISSTVSDKDEQAEEERKQRSIWGSQRHRKRGDRSFLFIQPFSQFKWEEDSIAFQTP